MNKILKIIGLVVLTSGLLGNVASAAATTSVTDKTGLTKAQEKIARIRNFTSAMEHRFDVIAGNLDSLAKRIENKIAELSQEGKDMTQAKAKLNDAKLKIQDAKVELTNLKQGVETMLTSSDPKKAFYNVRVKLVKNVMGKIKIAHQALVDTIKTIKQAGGAQGTGATTTSSGTSTAQ